MSMSIPQASPGAYVEQTHDAQGKPINPRKRGYIVRCEYPGGATTDSLSISSVWVKFDPDRDAEKVPMSVMNLIRPADEASLHHIRKETAEEAARKLVTGDMKKPVVVDRMGRPGRDKMTPEEAARL